MEKALFSVSCTTCRARIAVRSRSAIGQILECPKCSSMVMISPPDGWVEEVASPPQPAAPLAKAQAVVVTPPSDKTTKTVSGAPPLRESASGKAAVTPPPVQTVAAATAVSSAAAADMTTTIVATEPSIADAAPPSPPLEPVNTEGPQAIAVRMGFTPYTVPEAVAGRTYLSALTQSFFGRLAVLVLSGLVGLAGVLGIWRYVSHRQQPAVTKSGESTPEATADPAIPKSSLEQINRRWLPEDTICVLDLRPSRMARQSQVDLVDSLAQSRQPYAEVQSLRLALNLRHDQIRRVTWASTDLGDASKNSVAVLELEDGLDPAKFAPKGEEVKLGAGITAHRLRGAGWRNTVVAADARRIIAGNEDLLRRLAARGGDAQLSNAPMELLLTKFVPTGEVAVLLDFSTARNASWKLPADWLDVWPDGKSSWRLLCETPLAMGLSVQTAGEHRCELGLVCSGETMAERLRLEMVKLIDEALHALPQHIAGLKKTVPPDKVGAEACDQYRQSLEDLQASLHSYGCETTDRILWLRLGWNGQGLPGWIASMLDCKPAWSADRLAAARAVDEKNHGDLLKALHDYAKAQSPERFPAGAAGGARMFGPETRLSWIAELLPYLGHSDWKLDFANNWKSAENQRVTQRPLPEAVNPALGPAVAAGDYPVTHYVGAAGVGEDAAGLPPDDPRAGVFGYERQTRPQDLARGGANTIAILGVQERCGPWAQGGGATVRALTQQPYVNGPDGFGSGQAGGMVVGMADGSARFISKDVAPEIMEQLVTVRSGDKVNMAALDPQPPNLLEAQPPLIPAKPRPPVAKPKPAPPLDRKLRAQLNEPIQKLSLKNMPLGDAVQLVAAVGALPVTFDPDALEELGVSLHDQITVEAADANVGTLLDKIAAARGLARSVENGQVLLTSTSAYREEPRTLRYTVSDLTRGNPQAAAELAGLVQQFVAPQSWQAAGGIGAIEAEADVLRITQTGHVHHQVVVFCEKLRVARGLPPKSHLDAKAFSLESRVTRANGILGRAMTINAPTGTPLHDTLDQFKQPGTDIFIDRPALAAAGMNENTPTKFRSDGQPLGTVLRRLLDPLGLEWRAVDAATLQVTTKAALAARPEIEFYPVGKRLAGQPATAIIDQIKAAVPDATWNEVAPKAGAAAGVIALDSASQYVIVLQAQPVQVKIEAFLAQGTK